eukprot:5177503-Pyramimonas_sp.AAC.2
MQALVFCSYPSPRWGIPTGRLADRLGDRPSTELYGRRGGTQNEGTNASCSFFPDLGRVQDLGRGPFPDLDRGHRPPAPAARRYSKPPPVTFTDYRQ